MEWHAGRIMDTSPRHSCLFLSQEAVMGSKETQPAGTSGPALWAMTAQPMQAATFDHSGPVLEPL